MKVSPSAKRFCFWRKRLLSVSLSSPTHGRIRLSRWYTLTLCCYLHIYLHGFHVVTSQKRKTLPLAVKPKSEEILLEAFLSQLFALFLSIYLLGDCRPWSSTDCGHEEVRSVTYFVSSVNQYIRRNPIIGVEEREEPGNDVAFFVLHFSGPDALAFHNVLLFLVLNVARFLSDDHRMLVEPACGASLACVYERLFEGWKEQGKLAELKSVLVIVCGGNIVSLKALKEWKEKLGLS